MFKSVSTSKFHIHFKLFSIFQIGTDPNAFISKSNKHPNIVALGVSQKEICCYYVVVEQHLIPVKKYILFEFQIVLKEILLFSVTSCVDFSSSVRLLF